MANILNSPGRYVQGAGELSRLGGYAGEYGKKALILISASGYKRTGSMIEKSFEGTDCTILFDYFNGECCKDEIGRLTGIMEKEGCDLVIGVGGGKILDTAKAAAYYRHTPVIICPTIASTDAPCSALSVIYSESGVFEEYLFLPTNPDVVLVDTGIVSRAPARLLIAGMGDALSTYFEARACARSCATNCVGGKPTLAAQGLARLCYDTLLADGVQAALAVREQACTKALENIIEANTYLSGVGFESGGLAGAHAIHNGFTALPETHALYHGEKVAFGTLTQLVLENADKAELATVLDFCRTVGLPTTLADLGVTDTSRDRLMRVAELACAPNDTLSNMPFPVTPASVCAAIVGADALGRARAGR